MVTVYTLSVYTLCYGNHDDTLMEQNWDNDATMKDR